MNNENEDRPRRNHVKKVARSVKLRENEELHHPLHPPYVRKKEWKKDITTDDEGTDES